MITARHSAYERLNAALAEQLTGRWHRTRAQLRDAQDSARRARAELESLADQVERAKGERARAKRTLGALERRQQDALAAMRSAGLAATTLSLRTATTEESARAKAEVLGRARQLSRAMDGTVRAAARDEARTASDAQLGRARAYGAQRELETAVATAADAAVARAAADRARERAAGALESATAALAAQRSTRVSMRALVVLAQHERDGAQQQLGLLRSRLAEVRLALEARERGAADLRAAATEVEAAGVEEGRACARKGSALDALRADGAHLRASAERVADELRRQAAVASSLERARTDGDAELRRLRADLAHARAQVLAEGVRAARLGAQLGALPADEPVRAPAPRAGRPPAAPAMRDATLARRRFAAARRAELLALDECAHVADALAALQADARRAAERLSECAAERTAAVTACRTLDGCERECVERARALERAREQADASVAAAQAALDARTAAARQSEGRADEHTCRLASLVRARGAADERARLLAREERDLVLKLALHAQRADGLRAERELLREWREGLVASLAHLATEASHEAEALARRGRDDAAVERAVAELREALGRTRALRDDVRADVRWLEAGGLCELRALEASRLQAPAAHLARTQAEADALCAQLERVTEALEAALRDGDDIAARHHEQRSRRASAAGAEAVERRELERAVRRLRVANQNKRARHAKLMNAARRLEAMVAAQTAGS